MNIISPDTERRQHPFDAGAEAVKNASAVMHGKVFAPRPTAPLSPVTTGYVEPESRIPYSDAIAQIQTARFYFTDIGHEWRSRLLSIHTELAAEISADLVAAIECPTRNSGLGAAVTLGKAMLQQAQQMRLPERIAAQEDYWRREKLDAAELPADRGHDGGLA